MEYFFVLIVILFLFIGLLGCLIPAIPGPPISYLALFLSHFYISPLENPNNLWTWAIIVLIITILDFWVQIYGVKKFGGGRKSVNGSIIGLILGVFFIPVIGIIIGPFLGAFIGAMMEKKDFTNSFIIALGSFTGFIVGTLLKLSACCYIIYLIINSIISI